MDFQEIPNVPGFCISKEGKVKNPNGKILCQNKNQKGYWRVNIPGHNTQCIHRLLALTYITNPTNLPIVDHIDRNRQNNSLVNLRWVDDFGSSQNRGVSYKSTTGEKNIYYMKNRHGNYKYVYMKQCKIDGKKKKLAEKWFDTLDEAISFRDSLLDGRTTLTIVSRPGGTAQRIF